MQRTAVLAALVAVVAATCSNTPSYTTYTNGLQHGAIAYMWSNLTANAAGDGGTFIPSSVDYYSNASVNGKVPLMAVYEGVTFSHGTVARDSYLVLVECGSGSTSTQCVVVSQTVERIYANDARFLQYTLCHGSLSWSYGLSYIDNTFCNISFTGLSTSALRVYKPVQPRILQSHKGIEALCYASELLVHTAPPITVTSGSLHKLNSATPADVAAMVATLYTDPSVYLTFMVGRTLTLSTRDQYGGLVNGSFIVDLVFMRTNMQGKAYHSLNIVWNGTSARLYTLNIAPFENTTRPTTAFVDFMDVPGWSEGYACAIQHTCRACEHVECGVDTMATQDVTVYKVGINSGWMCRTPDPCFCKSTCSDKPIKEVASGLIAVMLVSFVAAVVVTAILAQRVVDIPRQVKRVKNYLKSRPLKQDDLTQMETLHNDGQKSKPPTKKPKPPKKREKKAPPKASGPPEQPPSPPSDKSSSLHQPSLHGGVSKEDVTHATSQPHRHSASGHKASSHTASGHTASSHSSTAHHSTTHQHAASAHADSSQKRHSSEPPPQHHPQTDHHSTKAHSASHHNTPPQKHVSRPPHRDVSKITTPAHRAHR